jgi:hypothetical protein
VRNVLAKINLVRVTAKSEKARVSIDVHVPFMHTLFNSQFRI